MPLGRTTPNSCSRPRISLTSAVRLLMSRARTGAGPAHPAVPGSYRHEPHAGPSDSLTDGFSVGRIVLVGLHIGFYVVRGHDPRLMSQFGQFTSPMVGPAAGLHAHNAARQLSKITQHLFTSKPLAHYHLSVRVHSVHLEKSLGKIKPDHAHLAHGPALRLGFSSPWRSYAPKGGGSIPLTGS